MLFKVFDKIIVMCGANAYGKSGILDLDEFFRRSKAWINVYFQANGVEYPG